MSIELTKKQRADIVRYRAQSYKDKKIAELVGVTESAVRSITRKGVGRPRKPEPNDQGHAKLALDAALENNIVSVRFKKVKCVLANFGDLLGLQIEDAPKVVAEYLKKKAKA